MSTDVSRPVRVTDRGVVRSAERRDTGLIPFLTSAPVLAGALTVLTLLAAGPLTSYDEQVHGHWNRELTPHLAPLMTQVLDRIAGQAVCVPVLVAVAATLAWRRRTWRPLWCAAAAEIAFYVGVGGMKVILARPSPNRGEADFLEGGLIHLGWQGISYPSGHAAEAVLVYGMAVFLIARYSSASTRTVRMLTVGVSAITVHAALVSFYLGWHWVTDLVGGVLAGGLLLRLLVSAERKDWGRLPAAEEPAGAVVEPGERERVLVRGG